MTELTPLIEWLSRLGPFGLLVVVCWLVFSGRLVLRRELDREREATAEERERREKAEEALDKARPVLEKAFEAMNRATELPERAVETVAEVAKRRDGARK